VWSELTSAEQEALRDFGYDQYGIVTNSLENTWNTCINHYTGFSWSDLSSYPRVLSMYKILGYNETSWDKPDSVDMEFPDWDGLTLLKKEGATYVGYNKESWDGDSLPWDDSAIYPYQYSCLDRKIPYPCVDSEGDGADRRLTKDVNVSEIQSIKR